MAGVSDLALGNLAQRCQEQTERFSRNELSDDRFCFELLRRALMFDLTDAFAHVYRIYERQVLAWLERDSRLARTHESAEHFANQAMSRFYFALRGPKFARFPTLQSVLAYLKVTTISVVTQFLRDMAPSDDPPVDGQEPGAPDPRLEQRLGAQELWARVCALLPEERDRWLAHCAFVQGMRPREIVRAFPSRWRSEREVTLALYRIRSILRADPGLREWG